MQLYAVMRKPISIPTPPILDQAHFVHQLNINLDLMSFQLTAVLITCNHKTICVCWCNTGIGCDPTVFLLKIKILRLECQILFDDKTSSPYRVVTDWVLGELCRRLVSGEVGLDQTLTLRAQPHRSQNPRRRSRQHKEPPSAHFHNQITLTAHVLSYNRVCFFKDCTTVS